MATRRRNGNGAAADGHGDGDALLASLTQRLLQLHESQQDQLASHPHSSAPATLPAPAAVASLRQRLRALLTIRPADPPLSPSVQSDIDRLLQLELKRKSIVQASALPRIAASNVDPAAAAASRSAGQQPPHLASLSRVSVWRGDITSLACDAVVNAANSGLCGCFQPTHRCIDNVLHDAAGPGLRAACHALMEAQGHEEREGRCKVTPAFNLPARFVLHTVGPFVNRDEPDEPTQQQADQLAACYTSCLDAAEATGSIASVAFCCISTGLFGYPQQEAATLAVRTVLGWLSAHPAAKVQHVIFDVFTDVDERIYQRILAAMVDGSGTAAAVAPDGLSVDSHPAASSSVPSSAALSSVGGFPVESTASPAVPPHVRVAADVARDIVAATAIAASPTPQLPEGVDQCDLETAAGWLRSAGGLLLCGGAGLSAAAGLDYTSSSVCHRLFPAMRQHGFHRFYQAIGKSDWDEELQWGYLFQQIYLARFSWPRSQVYQQLLGWAKRLDGDDSTCGSFVYTSNADGMFEQNGFDSERIYTAQGDYSRLQCLAPCGPDSVWPIRPYIDAALPHIDPRTQRLNPAHIPRCPRCQGAMMLNVRGGDWFLEESPYGPARSRYRQWLTEALKRTTADRPLVIVEVGAGFNTPGVIRMPMQRLAAQYPNVRLIRINAQYPQVPSTGADGKLSRAVGLGASAADLINSLGQMIGGDKATESAAAGQHN